MKVLVDRTELTRPLSELATSRLSDADPFVRRAAAEVLGAHPALANIRPLLALRQSTPADDTHLIHVVRMALRDQLKNRRSLVRARQPRPLRARPARHRRRRDRGPHRGSGRVSARTSQGSSMSRRTSLLRFVHHIARYGAADSMPELVALAVAEKRPPAERLELLKAIQQGTQERGLALDESSRRLAARLAGQLLGSRQPSEVTLGIDVVRDFQFRDMQAGLEESDRAPRPRRATPGCTPWGP